MFYLIHIQEIIDHQFYKNWSYNFFQELFLISFIIVEYLVLSFHCIIWDIHKCVVFLIKYIEVPT